MPKGRVVDMFSRKDMEDHGQDTAKNDKHTDDFGTFVGAVAKDKAKELRDQMASLNGRSKQIDAMVRQWEYDLQEHIQEIYAIVTDLGLDPYQYDPKSEDIMISEDGKVWVVPLPTNQKLQ